MKISSLKTITILFLVFNLASCSKDDVAPQATTKSVLTSINSSIGEYILNYNSSGNVTDVIYAEGSATFKYTYSWNTDSTILTKNEFHVNTNTATAISTFKFNADSTLAQYTRNTFGEYKVIYSFFYSSSKLSTMSIAENDSNADNVEVVWNSDNLSLHLNFLSGRSIGLVYTTSESPFLKVNQYAMATIMDKDLAIFNMLDKRMVWSISDTDDDLASNQEYDISGNILKSFTKNGITYVFTYSDIEVK